MNIELKDLPVIILAAGNSGRMGTPKGLLNYQGKFFLSHQINNLFNFGFVEISVVLGKDCEQYQTKVPELKQARVVINPNPEKGQFSSIQCSLAAIPENFTSGVFILPVDVPCPKKEVWQQLALELNNASTQVVVPSYQSKRGHPVLISNDFKNYLLLCSSHSRLDYEIKKQEKELRAKFISVQDRNILLNLNTLEDWKKFEGQQ